MSSPRSARPLLVALLRETRVSVGEFIREYQEHEVRSMTTYSGSVNFSPGSWVLWSPRGRVVVEKEDCDVVIVKSRTAPRAMRGGNQKILNPHFFPIKVIYICVGS